VTLFRSLLDAAYVDGNHTYQAILDDVSAASAVLYDDGILMGHDFCSHWRSREGGFGFVGAVTEFCKATGGVRWTCSSGLNDHTASISAYFIAKKTSASLKNRLLHNVFESKIGLVDLPLSIVGA